MNAHVPYDVGAEPTKLRERPAMNATETGSLITTTYDVRVIGVPWGAHLHAGTLASLADNAEYLAAYSVQVDAPMQYTRADDESELEYEARMVQCAADLQLRDFSEVIAWEIVKHERWSESPEGWRGYGIFPIGEPRTYTRKDRYTTLRAFTDEEGEVFDACMDHPEYD